MANLSCVGGTEPGFQPRVVCVELETIGLRPNQQVAELASEASVKVLRDEIAELKRLIEGLKGK
jgi:uncharacterized hydantoinase/oxoprolinase family protein